MLFIFVIKLPILISDIFLGSSPACTMVQLNSHRVVEISVDCAGNRLQEIVFSPNLYPLSFSFIDSHGLNLIFANILIF